MLRFAAVAALSSTLILSSGTPVLAAAPEVTSTGLTEGQLVGRVITITPTFSGADIRFVQILVDGVSNGTYGGEELTGSYQVGLLSVPNDSDVDITVRAGSGPGEIGAATTRVHVDNVMPTAVFSAAGINNQWIHGETTFTFSKVSEDVAEILVQGGEGRVIARSTSAPWILTGDVGKGVSTVDIIDRAGNVTRHHPRWTVDDTGPELQINSLVPGRVAPDADLNVWPTDPAGTARLQWWIDGQLVGTGIEIAHHFGTGPDPHTVEVRAWDRFGNQSSKTQTFVVDTTGPSVTWVSPAAGALIRGNRIWSTVQAADPAGFYTGLAGGHITGSPGDAATSGKVTGYRPVGKDGRYTLTWSVTDRLNNNIKISRTVTVDNTKPVLKVTKAPKNKVKVKGTVKVTAAAKDTNGVARVELLINGTVVAKDFKAGYAFSINTKKFGKKIKFQLRAYDKAGNVTTAPTRIWTR